MGKSISMQTTFENLNPLHTFQLRNSLKESCNTCFYQVLQQLHHHICEMFLPKKKKKERFNFHYILYSEENLILGRFKYGIYIIQKFSESYINWIK